MKVKYLIVSISKQLLFQTLSTKCYILHKIFQDGVAPISERGQKTIIWQDFCRKLHENKRHCTGGGVPSDPLRSANDLVLSSGPLDVFLTYYEIICI